MTHAIYLSLLAIAAVLFGFLLPAMDIIRDRADRLDDEAEDWKHQALCMKAANECLAKQGKTQ